MALSSEQKRVGLQLILAVIIVVLAYVLYVSITGPYEEVMAQQRMTEQTRGRMSLVRTALIDYNNRRDSFPDALDSLAAYVQSHPDLNARLDSMSEQGSLPPDSLIHSPRTGKKFEYSVNDTSRVSIYRLKDPDSEDVIGALEPDVTMVNSASWE